MRIIFGNRKLYIGTAVAVIIIMTIMINGMWNNNAPNLVTTTVETGQVRQLISVSGIANAKQTAELAFPTTGIVEQVLVDEGAVVAVGDTLVTLNARALYADRQDAAAALTSAIATRNELLAGPTNTSRNVTAETLTSKQEALATTKETEARKVQNAYRTLLSSDLTAYSTDAHEDAIPPTITGTYTCNTEGTYTLTLFPSNADSGYSYRLTGLETTTAAVTTNQPSPLGNCGLYVQFSTASASYNRSVWHIDIPNTRAASYTTNRNAYNLAITQAESTITLAEQAVTLAQADAINTTAPARDEAITRATAAISQAQARLARIDATIADRTLKAPFAGTITDVSVVPGETVTTAPIVTLLANGAFEVTARIPEIDIGKLSIDLPVEMLFDAKTDETIIGVITFISPKATEIDGVSYYDAIIHFTDTTPSWMRSGLNADIDIILTKVIDLRVPKRFITTTDTGHSVLRKVGETITTIPVDILLEGNDGYDAISGVTEGDILVAP